MLRKIIFICLLLSLNACSSTQSELTLDELLKRPLNKQPSLQTYLENTKITDNNEIISDIVYVFLAIDKNGKVTKHFIAPNQNEILVKNINLAKLPTYIPPYTHCKETDNGQAQCTAQVSYLKYGIAFIPELPEKVEKEKINILNKLPIPHYPKIVKQMKKESKISLLLIIDKQGKIDDIKMLEPSEIKELNQAVLDTYKKVVRNKHYFSPSIHNGKPIARIAVLPIKFRLAIKGAK